MGSTADMVNVLTFMPSVTDTIFLLFLTTVNSPSHLPDFSLNTLIRSLGRIMYFLAGGNFDYSGLVFLDSATIVSILGIASFIAPNLSICFRFVLDCLGNVGQTPYTNNDGTNPLGPMFSLFDLIGILKMILT